MTNFSVSAPVLFLIFNRPHTTLEVFNAIRKAKPKKLYIAGDGPRSWVSDDLNKCRAARNIATKVDWPCEVKTLFRDENLGAGRGVAEAITWFLQHETEGIILEDDCLPGPDFFIFCTELLSRFRDDKRIMAIGGNNLLKKSQRDEEYSYSFSKHNYTWGWATWRRAWKLFDYKTKHYKEICDKGYLKNYFHTRHASDYFKYIFDNTFLISQRNIWDYQWDFAGIIHSGLTIVPANNLVINIGFGRDATHTFNEMGFDWSLEKMTFPLKHPEFVMVHETSDKRFFKTAFTTRSSRMKSVLKRIIPPIIMEKVVKPVLEKSNVLL